MKRNLALTVCSTVIIFSTLACGKLNRQSLHADDSRSGQIEPFGFKAGMTKKEIIAALGASSVQKDNGDRLSLSTAPKPHPDFVTYVIYVSRSKGLAKVLGISKLIETNSFGEQLTKEFQDIQTALEHNYGKPADTLDFVRAGSEWKEPRYWMMGLLKQDRHLLSTWKPIQGTTIMLVALARSTEVGTVNVYYEFGAFPMWKQEHDEENDKSL